MTESRTDFGPGFHKWSWESEYAALTAGNSRMMAAPRPAFADVSVRGGLSRQVQPLHRVRDRYAYTYDLAASRWLLPSERLRPSSAWQVGAGAEWAPGHGLAFSLDGYVRTLHDVLEPLAPFEIGRALEGPGVEEDDLLRFYRPTDGRAIGLELAASAWARGAAVTLVEARPRVRGGLPAGLLELHDLQLKRRDLLLQGVALALDFLGDRMAEPFGGGDEPGRAVRPVLGLAEQVGPQAVALVHVAADHRRLLGCRLTLRGFRYQ